MKAWLTPTVWTQIPKSISTGLTPLASVSILGAVEAVDQYIRLEERLEETARKDIRENPDIF